MTNKEQNQRDIVIAFDFAEQIIDNSTMLDKITEKASITFLDDENIKPERRLDKRLSKKICVG